MQHVIGLVGPIASGKSTVANFFVAQGFAYFKLSDIIRQEIKDRDLVLDRTTLQDVGNELRQKFSGAVLAMRVAEKIMEQGCSAVVDGVRNPDEVFYLRDKLGAKIIKLESDYQTRLKRYLSRAGQRGEDKATPQDFAQVNSRDLGAGEGAHGQRVKETMELANVVFSNNGSVDKLHRYCQDYLDQVTHQTQQLVSKQDLAKVPATSTLVG